MKDRAKQAGARAVSRLQDRLLERAADLIKANPKIAANAAEVGLIDRDWLENPTDNPVRSATTIEIIQRFLERSIEQQPSIIATLGLDTIELLTMSDDDDVDGSTPTQPLTVVFTDLEGFTAYTEHEGDEAALELLDRHHRSVGPIVRSRGGRTVKKIGDGLLLSFPVPEAAVLACLELQELDHGPLRLRAGIHAGEAVVTRGDLIGHDVNLAARVADAAHGGETLVTVDVRAAVGDLPGVSFGQARTQRFKGMSDPVMVCPVRRRPAINPGDA